MANEVEISTLGKDHVKTASQSARSGAVYPRVSRCMRDGTSSEVQVHQSGRQLRGTSTLDEICS